MSVMSELAMEIEDLLIDGTHPTVVAKIMGVPLTMVYDVLETMASEPAEEFSPYDTVNS